MSFLQTLASSIKGMFPGIIYWLLLPQIPFIMVEQLRPVGDAPSWRDYVMNIWISLTTAFLSLPLGMAAGLWSSRLRHVLPWTPISFTFHKLDAVPFLGHGLTIVAMILVPLFIHDFWFYWSHRIEYKVPILWEFHKINHSDEHMNTSSWARDHFLQEGWRSFFSVFTLGLIIDLQLREAGEAALYSTMFLIGLSMFYHSAIRVRLPWLDRILVTPQVHRIIMRSTRSITIGISPMRCRSSISYRHLLPPGSRGVPRYWARSGLARSSLAVLRAIRSCTCGRAKFDETKRARGQRFE